MEEEIIQTMIDRMMTVHEMRLTLKRTEMLINKLLSPITFEKSALRDLPCASEIVTNEQGLPIIKTTDFDY